MATFDFQGVTDCGLFIYAYVSTASLHTCSFYNVETWDQAKPWTADGAVVYTVGPRTGCRTS